MKRRALAWIGVLAGLGIGFFAITFGLAVHRALKLCRTYDTLGAIKVAMNNALTPETLSTFDLVTETRKYGHIPTAGGKVLDPWGNPIAVVYSLAKAGHITIHLQSAGPDGLFGTRDDIKEDEDMSPPR